MKPKERIEYLYFHRDRLQEEIMKQFDKGEVKGMENQISQGMLYFEIERIKRQVEKYNG